MHAEFLAAQVGTQQEILVEKRKSPDYINGYTPNYTPVRIYGADISRHSIVKVKITGAENGYCIGEEMRD